MGLQVTVAQGGQGDAAGGGAKGKAGRRRGRDMERALASGNLGALGDEVSELGVLVGACTFSEGWEHLRPRNGSIAHLRRAGRVVSTASSPLLITCIVITSAITIAVRRIVTGIVPRIGAIVAFRVNVSYYGYGFKYPRKCLVCQYRDFTVMVVDPPTRKYALAPLVTSLGVAH